MVTSNEGYHKYETGWVAILDDTTGLRLTFHLHDSWAKLFFLVSLGIQIHFALNRITERGSNQNYGLSTGRVVITIRNGPVCMRSKVTVTYIELVNITASPTKLGTISRHNFHAFWIVAMVRFVAHFYIISRFSNGDFLSVIRQQLKWVYFGFKSEFPGYFRDTLANKWWLVENKAGSDMVWLAFRSLWDSRLRNAKHTVGPKYEKRITYKYNYKHIYKYMIIHVLFKKVGTCTNLHKINQVGSIMSTYIHIFHYKHWRQAQFNYLCN